MAPCPLGELRPQAPRELLTLVHDMLAKERAARPPMEEVRARLDDIDAGSPLPLKRSDSSASGLPPIARIPRRV